MTRAWHTPIALSAATVRTVAVLTASEDVAALAAHGGLRRPDPIAYRRQLARHLDRLACRRGEVRVARFDPMEYSAFCRQHGVDPGSAAVRARYAGEAAGAGPTLRYRRQPVGRLLATLHAVHERERTAERAASLLAAAAECGRCGRTRASCAVREASAAVTEAVRRAGSGLHRVVCTLAPPEGQLTAVAHCCAELSGRPRPVSAPATGGGESGGDPADLWLLLRLVLAAALVHEGGGGLMLRSLPEPGTAAPHEVRGWAVSGGRLRPLSEAEVFAACCTEPGTGAPVPPEPGVVHRPATELPDQRCR